MTLKFTLTYVTTFSLKLFVCARVLTSGRAALVIGVRPMVSDVMMIDSVGMLGGALWPAAGTRTGSETTHEVLVREPEHGRQVAADVSDREQSERNAEHCVDDCSDSASRCLRRNVPVAYIRHVMSHTLIIITTINFATAAAAAVDDNNDDDDDDDNSVDAYANANAHRPTLRLDLTVTSDATRG